MLQNAINAGIIPQPDVSVTALSAFILYGISGIIHQEPITEITPEFTARKKQDAIRLIASILKVPIETIGG